MDENPSGGGTALIESTPSRVLFAELVAGALERTRLRPTPMATAYLVELLDERLRQRPVARDANGAEETLAEGLLAARQERGAARLHRLRSLGDRALFVSGFFGDSLSRRVVGLSYYGDTGRLAYAHLASALASRLTERPWAELFEELAGRFAEFVDVLSEVGDHTRARAPDGLLFLYDRYLRMGSERDRRRLVRLGHSIPSSPSARLEQ
jgi:hypothetical protein